MGWYLGFNTPLTWLRKRLRIWRMKIKSLAYGLVLLFFVCLSFILLVNLLIVKINAEAPTSTYYETNEMYLTGKLLYIGSAYGEPVNNLDGTTHEVFLNAEAERKLSQGAAGQYLTNLSSNTVTGYLDNGYTCQIPYADCLWVQQTLYYGTGSTTREGWAYYEVVVDEIQTNLLYRPERNDRYITIITAGALLFGLITIFKVVRRD